MNAPTSMLPRDLQHTLECTYSKKHIDRYIRLEIEANPDMLAKIQHGVQLLTDWQAKAYYESKNERLAQLEGIDFEELVTKVFINVAYCQTPELFTSVSAQLASVLKMSEKGDSILTIAEMLAVLCLTDAFDIDKPSAAASLMVQSQIPLSDRLLDYVNQTHYLPPMVCEPDDLTSNFESPYLTHNESVILGKGNHHSEDVCLDVINTQNQIPLTLNLEMLTQIEMEPKKPHTLERILEQAHKAGERITEGTAMARLEERLTAWERYKVQTYEVCHLLAQHGNRFWLTWAVDKRGRLYSRGYHVHLQGSSWNKAVLDLADKEVIEDVPECFRKVTAA